MANRLVEEKGGNYVQGIGTLQIAGDKVIITMNDKRYEDVSKASLPEGVVSGEQYSIRLSGDGTELWSIRPVQASVVVMFEKFAGKKDEIPQPTIQKGGPREYQGKKWFAEDKLVFTAILKVVSKRYKGMEIPYIMDYTFRQYEDTTDTIIPYGSKKKQQVLDFLKFFGWDAEIDAIPYSDNVLPFLAKLLQSKGVKLLATVDKGYISNLSPYDSDLMVS